MKPSVQPLEAPAQVNVKQVNHLAIIPDGNRRWARQHGLTSQAGHQYSFTTVAPELIAHCWQQGIHTVTLWLFSTENWKRTPTEVAHLMQIYHDMLQLLLPVAAEHQACLKHLGRADRLPQHLQRVMAHAQQQTAGHTRRQFNFALDYGGQDEISRAAQKMAQSPYPGNSQCLASWLDTAHDQYPNPDVVVRTSGQVRTSGFMIWQTAYSEYFFIDKHFPAFTCHDLDTVVGNYQKRSRTYGR